MAGCSVFVWTSTWSVAGGGTGRRPWVCVRRHVVQWVILVCVQRRVCRVEITKLGYQLQEPGKLEQGEIHRRQIKSKRHREGRGKVERSSVVSTNSSSSKMHDCTWRDQEAPFKSSFKMHPPPQIQPSSAVCLHASSPDVHTNMNTKVPLWQWRTEFSIRSRI